MRIIFAIVSMVGLVLGMSVILAQERRSKMLQNKTLPVKRFLPSSS